MISKREPKHIGEVMSDIAERYDKLTKTKKMMKNNHKSFVYGFLLATIMCWIASCIIIGVYFN